MNKRGRGFEKITTKGFWLWSVQEERCMILSELQIDSLIQN